MNTQWQLYYECNKLLDDAFDKKYGNIPDMHEKNCIELLIELGEFINESKCFKYWSIKKPDINNLYEEAADVMQMILYFYNYYGIVRLTLPKLEMTDNVIDEINYLYIDASRLLKNGNKKLCKKIFCRFMHIINLLNMNEVDLLNACYKKNTINYERLNSNY